VPARQEPKPERYLAEVKALSQRVRALRYERGWTLEETAERMDIDLSHLQRIEAGTLNLTFLTLTRVAQGFDVALWALFLDPNSARGG
jgi:transcriptional regulator with XRE-family HTH domain